MRRFAGVFAVAGLLVLGGVAAFSQAPDKSDAKREEELRASREKDEKARGDEDRRPARRDGDDRPRRRGDDDRGPPRGDDDGPRPFRGHRPPHFPPPPWEPGKVMPPHVRHRLDLNSEQERQLGEIEKDVKDRILKLLTDEQKTKLEEFKRRGPPSDDRRGPPPRRGDRRGPRDDDDDDRRGPRDDRRPPRDDDRPDRDDDR